MSSQVFSGSNAFIWIIGNNVVLRYRMRIWALLYIDFLRRDQRQIYGKPKIRIFKYVCVSTHMYIFFLNPTGQITLFTKVSFENEFFYPVFENLLITLMKIVVLFTHPVLLNQNIGKYILSFS